MTPANPSGPPTRPPGFLARWSAALAVGVVAGGMFGWIAFAPPFDQQKIIRSDGLGYHVWTYAILKGDPTFSWFIGEPRTNELFPLEANAPKYACKYPPGVALVRLPAMIWVVDSSRSGPPYSLAENLVCLAFGLAALLGVAVLGILTCRDLGLPLWWSQFAVLVIVFGAGLFHFGTFDACYSHIYSALGAAWLVRQAARSRRPDERLPIAGALSIFAVAAIMILIRITNAFILAFWAAGMAWRDMSSGRRPIAALASAAGTLLGLAATIGLNWYVIGRVTLNTYPGEGFVWDRPMMLSVLTGGERGVLTSYPVLGFTILAGLLARPSRPAAAGLGFLVLAYAALYGYWDCWFLGVSFGHRGFVELAPFAIPVLAAALAAIARRSPWVGAGVAVLCAALSCLTVQRMCHYWWEQMPR